MATKNEADSDDALNPGEFTDFVFVLNDDTELQCHKIMLAKASPVFRRMLRKDCEETRTSKMKVTEFEPVTVKSFLDFIYADLEYLPYLSMFEKEFDKKRLTTDLLRMSHMYEVRIIQDMCVQHLMDSIVDDNVVDIWSTAEIIGNNSLKEAALEHLVEDDREQEKMIMDFPGMKEAFKSPQLVESLVSHMSAVITHLSERLSANCKKTLNKTKEEITVKVKVASFEEDISVKVKLSDTIATLRKLTNATLSRMENPDWECDKGTFKLQIHSTLESGPLDERKTIKHYRITNGSIFTAESE